MIFCRARTRRCQIEAATKDKTTKGGDEKPKREEPGRYTEKGTQVVAKPRVGQRNVMMGIDKCTIALLLLVTVNKCKYNY